MRATIRAALCLGLVLLAAPASARLKHRVPAFEPTDLDLEDPYTVELGLQYGVMFRDAPPKTRIFVPDFELDLGLTQRVELDVDGAFSLDDQGTHYALTADNLWTCVKLGFVTARDDLVPERAWSLGAQIGPILPTAPNSFGTGFGAVLLAARMDAPWHVIANFGTALSPQDRTEHRRSAGLLGGFDLDYDLDRDNHWSLLGELAGGYSLGVDPNDVHATLGVDLAALAWLDLSLVGFYGFLPGGDRSGVFLGVTPKFALNGAGP